MLWRVPVCWATAGWFERGVGPDPNSDYLSLAFCAMTERELAAWLGKQPNAVPTVPAWLQRAELGG